MHVCACIDMQLCIHCHTKVIKFNFLEFPIRERVCVCVCVCVCRRPDVCEWSLV